MIEYGLRLQFNPFQTMMVELGLGAFQSAQANIFSCYQRGKSTNTRKTQYRALQMWAQFLNCSAE
jgi:hypothetical protein